MNQTSILLVEDEYNIRMGISLTLQEYGEGKWNVDLAENGLRALEMLRANHYNLLITDIRMPSLNGIELLEELKKENIYVTSMLLTGFAEFGYAQSGLRLGAVDYLLKPIQQEELVNAVNKALKLSQKKNEEMVNNFLVEEGIKKIVGVKEANNPYILSAIEYMKMYLHTPLAIKDVANHVHLNPSYLSVLFKEEMGMSFSDFVTKLRLKKARELLIVTDNSIDEISKQVGYQTTSYFIRMFKNIENMTPKQYRNMLFEKEKFLNKYYG